ncbi:hypothetical protein [Morganella psychrotolerans]|uniref:Uncharacterized protein n=1 Tax=Morganella psychrotolerans TaxID=368603 RepID=A0A1B8HEB6_9GAMM|nr:hypothetical protein [Morganella psychrotolerans]OBU07424.1 hypothetical protein AYY17_05370 [Morganella psychrotolerans]
MDFSVLVTFDLNYCKTPEYRVMERTLTDMNFQTSSDRSGLGLPSNTYLGIIEVPDVEMDVDDIQSGAKGAINYVSTRLRNAIKATGKTGKFYVTAAPKEMTIDYCSR